MPRTLLTTLALCLATLTAGCQIGQPSAGPGSAVTPNAVAGEAIEVTALDDPSAPQSLGLPAETGLTAIAPGGAEGPAPVQGDPAPPVSDETPAGAVPAPQPEAAAEVPPPKSASQLACERRNGTWTSTGSAGLRTCVLPTRDGGKQCTRESQCDSTCLARSRTCAPIKPLLGCHEVLQDNGARVTSCLE